MPDLELGVKITGIKKKYPITNLIRISKEEKGYYYIINSCATDDFLVDDRNHDGLIIQII